MQRIEESSELKGKYLSRTAGAVPTDDRPGCIGNTAERARCGDPGKFVTKYHGFASGRHKGLAAEASRGLRVRQA